MASKQPSAGHKGEALTFWLTGIAWVRDSAAEERERFLHYDPLTIPAYIAATRSVWPEMVEECLKSSDVSDAWIRVNGLHPSVLVEDGARNPRLYSPDFIRMLRIILDDGRAVIETRHFSALEEMVRIGQVDAFQLLLDAYLKRQPLGSTWSIDPTSSAVAGLLRSGMVDAAKAIFANPLVSFSAPSSHDDPLLAAILSAKTEMVEFVYDHPILVATKCGTVYAEAAVVSGNVEILRRVIAISKDKGVCREDCDLSGCLLSAVAANRAEMVDLLVSDPRTRSDKSIAPELFARTFTIPGSDVLRLVITKYLTTDEERMEAINRNFVLAINRGNVAAVRYMLEFVFGFEERDGNAGDMDCGFAGCWPEYGKEKNVRAVADSIQYALDIGKAEVAAMMLGCPLFAHMYNEEALRLREIAEIPKPKFTRCIHHGR